MRGTRPSAWRLWEALAALMPAFAVKDDMEARAAPSSSRPVAPASPSPYNGAIPYS